MSSELLSKNLKIYYNSIKYNTIILPDALYGCETWSLMLREERSLRVRTGSGDEYLGPKKPKWGEEKASLSGIS